MEKRRSLIYLVVAMYGLLLCSCSDTPVIEYKYDGFLHPSSPKLHNIQVVNTYYYNDTYEKIYYFSFKDSTYHKCFIPDVFKSEFQVGKIIE